MQKPAIQKFSVALAMIGFMACAPTSPKLVPQPPAKNEKIRNDGDTSVVFNNQVDILFVIDDSGSMDVKQQNVVKNIDLFLQGFQTIQNLDYHIGVVTTTMERSQMGTSGAWGGRLVANPTYLDNNTPNFAQVLRHHIQVGTTGSPTEQHFPAVMAALSAPIMNYENAGFYRPDAYLAIISISDAEAQGSDAITFYNFLMTLKQGDQSKLLYYAAYIPTNDRTCSRSGEDPPYEYEKFFKLINAKTFGLCDPDFGGKLANFGIDLGQNVSGTLYLSRLPQPGTIVITFGTQIIPSDFDTGWSYDASRNAIVLGKHIQLSKTQPKGTKITVNFTAVGEK